MKDTLNVVNAYVHDFASALWLASVLVVYWIGRYALPHGVEDFISGIKKDFFYIGIASLVVILITGVGRTIAYRSGEYGEGAEKKRKEILIVKHILGMILYGAGTYWQYTMVY